MSLYDAGCVQIGADATPEISRMRAAANVFRQSGDSRKAAALERAADVKEEELTGARQDARLHRTKQRLAARKTGWGLTRVEGVAVAAVGVIGVGMWLHKKG